MKFILEIKLGNDAMTDPADVADALEGLAATLRDNGFDEDASYIRGANGNTVGRWKVTETPRIPKALTAHEYQPNDLGTDGCSVCGKAKAWRFHSYIRGKAVDAVEWEVSE